MGYLRIIYPPEEPEIMYLAAKIITKLILSGGRLCSEFKDFEISRSLRWIQSSQLLSFYLSEKRKQTANGLDSHKAADPIRAKRTIQLHSSTVEHHLGALQGSPCNVCHFKLVSRS